MWAWRKKSADEPARRGAARAALTGAEREEVLREVIHSIATDLRADRIGIWLEQDLTGDLETHPAPDTLRGVVWERHEEHTPAEWEKLSLESPVPHDLLLSGTTVEQAFDASATRPVFGPLIGLHHVLWLPIRAQGRLHGVALIGSQRKQVTLPRELAEGVLGELALALAFEEQRRLAHERQADLRLNKHILSALAAGTSTDTILCQLAENCTELSAGNPGPRASFVVIGHLPAKSPGSSTAPEMEFAWESGDATWTHGVDREPLSGLWQKALEAGHVLGMEAPASWSASGLARLVAIPLASAELKLGVFIAGISQRCSSLNSLERLELRASLAATTLERRRLRSQRIRSVARRQALLESSPEPTVLLDASGNVASANQVAEALFEEKRASGAHDSERQEARPAGTEVAWYVGAHFAHLFCAREQPRIEDWSREALAPERDKSAALRPPCEAQLLNGVRVRLHAPVSVGGDLAAIVLELSVPQDVSVPRSPSDAELHHVLEWVEEGILLFSANQTIRGMNTRFAQIAGLSPDEAASCATLDNLIEQLEKRAAEPAAFAARWRELARGAEGGTREELQMARPVPRVLERSVRPILDSQGRRLGRLEIYRDLSAKRVFQAKLLQTEKLAALGQMMTGVAHELSNPLTSILGYSQRLLVREDLAGRTAEARQIYQEAERASAILRQLLLTARETQSERKRVSLNQVVQKAMELQRFGSASEKIRLELDLDSALPFVKGDFGQLQQVLMNLIGNARQAIVHEGRAGTIRLRTARTGEHRVQLQVIDDGPGIPQAILARIFDPFFTTKPAGVGTGLGLSVVLSVVREHGGQIHVANGPDGGATFTVELPTMAETSDEPASPPLSSRAKAAPALAAGLPPKKRLQLADSPAARASHRGTRVLVVEDEPTVARLIADVLEDEGMRVDVLLDGREAPSRATRESYGLVVCDMKMPGLDGQNLYRSLVQAGSPLKDRFLFVTGDVLAPQTQEFLERNRIPHVAKPFRVEELTERINTLLDGQLARAGRAAAGRKAH